MPNWLKRVVLAILVLNLLYYGLDWMARHAKNLPAVTPAQKAGYETLLAAADQVTMPDTDLLDMPSARVTALAAKNSAILTNVLKTLEEDIRVPLAVTKDWLDDHKKEIKHFRRLASALVLESRAQNLNGQTNAAPQLAIIHLGQAICHGGLIFDGIEGLTVEALGDLALQGLVPSLNADQCRIVAQNLEQWDSHREPAAQILATNTRWFTIRYGLVGRILILTSKNDKTQDEFTPRYNKVRTTTLRIMIRAATRACLLETGKTPARIQDLVPSYLKTVPTQPETGKAMELPSSSEK
jgi:hypothetical protein